MFFIWDVWGWVIVFGGWVMDLNDNVKYLNLFEIVLFDKGCNLYNYGFVCEVMGKDYCLIFVEGYMDVIVLFEVGFKGVVVLFGIVVIEY